jgi:hypothetical protein
MRDFVSVKATTLTPFNYGHLPISSGVATIPMVIGDRAIAFATASALGMMRASAKLPSKDYKSHLAAMPWRCSVFETDSPRLLPPIARRSDLGIEGGYPSAVRRAAASGNFKEFFFIQEVPQGQVFTGAFFGADPFDAAGTDEIVVRIGSGRTGMVLLQRDGAARPVRLNASTAILFGQRMPVESYLLHELQLSLRMDPAEASRRVKSWN